MNYLYHYNKLIETRKSRIPVEGVYYEKHHIKPRCLGGDDSPDNLVKLTAKEHYMAHLLLAKAYPGNHKLVFAFNMMRVNGRGKRNNSRRHNHLKEEFRNAMKSIKRTPLTEEQRKLLSKKYSGSGNPMYGKKGNDHPATGIMPWRNQISHPNHDDYRYFYLIYDLMKKDKECNPFNKKSGHKRICQMLGFKESEFTLCRAMTDKINDGFNPYENEDLKIWCKDKEIPTMDLSKFDYPECCEYAYILYDWTQEKLKLGFKKGFRFTTLFKEHPELKNIDNIPYSHFMWLLEDEIQNKKWNPYEDKKFETWYKTWYN